MDGWVVGEWTGVSGYEQRGILSGGMQLIKLGRGSVCWCSGKVGEHCKWCSRLLPRPIWHRFYTLPNSQCV